MTQDERIEMRAADLHELWTAKPGTEAYMNAWRRIARVELEREHTFVLALRGHRSCDECCRVLAAYEAEFAPKQRTVEQIARDIVAYRVNDTADRTFVPLALLHELAAALAAGRE